MLLWDYKESIPGEPEVDYPILEKIPKTSFNCVGRLAGYYANIETRCQVFHVCSFLPEGEAVQNDFLCPNGTMFNQENFACQWWADVNCPTSDQFYRLNAQIGVVPVKEVVSVKRQAADDTIAAPANVARSERRQMAKASKRHAGFLGTIHE